MKPTQQLSVRETADKVQRGECTALEVLEQHLLQVERLNPHLNAFVSVDADLARAQATAIDQNPHLRAQGPLAGVPVSVKDLIAVEGYALTAGSKMLQSYKPPADATVVDKLRRAGAIVLGKVSLDEFAMGSTNESAHQGPVRNPWALDRVPGGSSGGSAAAVAGFMGCASLGTDTGGSVRLPAAFCGVVGLKPTYGRVSRSGVVAYASSLDQVGPIARDIRDAARLLEVVAGSCPADSTSVDRPVERWEQLCDHGVEGLRFGVVSAWLEGASDAVSAAVERASEALVAAGATRLDLSLPTAPLAVPAYYIIAMSEASTNLARYDGVRFGHRAALEPSSSLDELYSLSRAEGFGQEVRKRIVLGTWALSSGYYDAYYDRACRVRRLVSDELIEALQSVDVILGPTAPRTAWPLGDSSMDPLHVYQMDVYTTAANLAGVPALSMPWGQDEDGLPVAIQLHGAPWREDLLCRFGAALELSAPALPAQPLGVASLLEETHE